MLREFDFTASQQTLLEFNVEKIKKGGLLVPNLCGVFKKHSLIVKNKR